MSKRTQTPSSPEFAYRSLFAQVRLRLMHYHKLPSMPIDEGGELPIIPAEWLALQVRKICEAVAFAAVTGEEFSSGRSSPRRIMAPKNVLKELKKHPSVVLPQAVDVQRDEFHRFMLLPRPDRNWTLESVLSAWHDASQILHVKHPDDAQAVWLDPMREEMERLLASLKAWLWTHTIVYQQKAVLIQMGQYPHEFLTNLSSTEQPSPHTG